MATRCGSIGVLFSVLAIPRVLEYSSEDLYLSTKLISGCPMKHCVSVCLCVGACVYNVSRAYILVCGVCVRVEESMYVRAGARVPAYA